MDGGSKIVALNVGGTILQTRRGTLKNMPMIDAMLDAQESDYFDDSSQDAIFIDRDPRIFQILLNIARGWPMSMVDRLTSYEREAVYMDADYFQMSDFPRSANCKFRLNHIHDHAMITNDGTACTIGKVHYGNTVLATESLPADGRVYWEVLVVKKPTNNGWDYIGVADGAPVALPGRASREGTISRNKDMSQKGCWSWSGASGGSRVMADTYDQKSDVLPPFKDGLVVGVDVDMDVGSLSFWANGQFEAKVVSTALKGKTLFPAVSVFDRTVMHLRTGLQPPNLVLV